MSKINLSPINNLQNEASVTATINNNNTLITAAVENSISRDGTQPNQMNSELDMNSNKIINLPDAFTDQEPVTYGQFIDGITSVNNGVVVDGAFVMLSHNDTTINDRVLTGTENIEVIDGGPKSNVEIRLSDVELNALATVTSDTDKLPYFTGSGTADVTDFTDYARTLVDDADAETARATLGVVIDTDVQPHDPTLNSLVNAGNGIMAKTATNIIEARTITGTSNEITVSAGDGISGDPTISLPTSLTFTGKTVSGGSFSSPSITTPTGIVKADVGLSNVDNTSDANKPISTATQTALDAKVTGPASSVNGRIATYNGGTGKFITDSGKSLPTGLLVGISDTQTLTNKTLTSPVINSPTGIVKADVGLSNVDNTSDSTKNSASVTLTNKIISGSSNTLSNISNASLSSVADSTIKSNVSGSSAAPSDNTITAVLDKQLGTTQGTIAYRGASAWSALTPGTSGNFLQTSGTGANPAWVAIPGGGDLLSTNNLSDLANIDTARSNIKTLGGGLKSQVFGTSGTFTTPSTSRTDTVYRYRIQAGGGGGGGANGTNASAGGGGAGAYAEGTFTGVAASTGITVTIGAAGSAGAAANTGGSGGASSLGSPVSISCGGGSGGVGIGTGNNPGGLGGAVTGSPNIISVPGRGGSAGWAINGTGIANGGGDGGSSMLGVGGVGGRNGISGAASVTPTGYGAGGGAGFANGAGNAGSQGIIIIEWFES